MKTMSKKASNKV
jgi:hypothetical protein